MTRASFCIKLKSMKYDSIIFDLDGTLWDSSASVAEGWNKGLSSLGIDKQIQASDIQGVMGKPQEECVKELFPEQNNQELIDTLSKFEESSLRSLSGTLYEGVTEVIPKLAQHYPLYLISNCNIWYLKLFLEQKQMLPYFQDADCVGLSRLPKYKMIQNMVEKHSLKTPVYVGDTSGDQQSAHNAKIDFIYAKYGFGNCKNTEQSVKNLKDLESIFLT